jgi:tetratricopeptide (TPR) repeat protein
MGYDKKDIYKLAYNFLLRNNKISSEIINIHLVPEYSKPKNLNEIFKRFCESAQNRQMLPKVIGSAIGGFDNLSKVLYDFNPNEVVKTYSKNDASKLLEKIIKDLKPKGQIRKTNRSIWPQYCISVIDIAYFLKQFKTAEEFYEWADRFANDTKSKPALPLLISLEISGIGFPLACDLLKELGYSNFAKPDVHLKDIFQKLKLIDNVTNEMKLNINILRAVDSIAEYNGISSYAVDKVFWLIGSGDFYRSKIDIGSSKKKFIEYILEL